ncbi:MAG: tRNA (adenosine(37)-N6)-threonylcarbamoyltransferase complex dimerization subunit type 1 TsaB [Desulfovibrionales bacterium]|nr:tRNA (adenosine(37)-N6)-threonylcarbamoyltransferase complex dimerization subunit type 1 TsaB [Desulfovibrionales bacterium]
MKILAVDTSTHTGSVALTDNGAVLAEYSLFSKETHSRRLLQAVEHLLAQTGLALNDIDGLAVTIGPGSFTGIRIGLATFKGLALATGKPVVGISSLDALAANFPVADRPVFPVIDARKKEVFTAAYYPNEDGRLIKTSPELALSPQDLVVRIKERVILVGDGARSYGEFFEKELGDKAFFAPGPFSFIRASNVAFLAAEKFKAGEQADIITMVPAYIRPSEAELKWAGKDGDIS